VCA
jgi:hypothetical protein